MKKLRVATRKTKILSKRHWNWQFRKSDAFKRRTHKLHLSQVTHPNNKAAFLNSNSYKVLYNIGEQTKTIVTIKTAIFGIGTARKYPFSR